MTVVEKIHRLQDLLITLGCYGKSYEIAAQEAEIRAKLEQIRKTCLYSWQVANARRP